MALAVGNILQITDVQSLLGQQVLNVYFYRLLSFESGVTYQVIADNWETLVCAAIRNVQHTALTHTSLLIKNLTNGIDIHEEADVQTGIISGGEVTQSFTSIGVRLIRTTAQTRHGSKRIAGLPEAYVGGNTFAFPGGVQAALETALGTNVVVTGTVDNDFEMQPVIVGRYPQGDPDAGKLDLSIINPVQAAQVIRVTTQNTRKAGRGS